MSMNGEFKDCMGTGPPVIGVITDKQVIFRSWSYCEIVPNTTVSHESNVSSAIAD